MQAWVVGPGLGTDDAGAAALWFALDTDLPVIVDADGLTILAAHPDLVAGRSAPTVLTPHAGEFARLAGSPPGDDRVAATRRLADAFGATVLLKGNVTVIAEPGGPGLPQPRRAVVGGHRRLGRRAVRHHRRAARRGPARRGSGRGRGVRARPRGRPVGRRPGPGAAPTSASRILAHVRTASLASNRPRKDHPCPQAPAGPRRSPPPTPGGCPLRRSPSLRLPDESMDPEAAYRFIHDELMLDGSSRLNLATFVTTWMDPEAEKLMAETFDKNMIDKDEYPATAAIEAALRVHGRRPVPRRGPARRRPVQRDRGVHHRVQRGRDAGRVWR